MENHVQSEKTDRLFDLAVHAESLEETGQRCISLVERTIANRASRRPALVFSLNPEKAVQSARDASVHALLQRATLLIPDGVGICMAARVLTGRRMRRVPGSDLMPLLCTLAEKHGMTVYLYGASPQSNALAVANMRSRWPALKLVGASDGYQPPGDSSAVNGDTADPAAGDRLDETVAGRIRALHPDIVFVGLGSPRQERWMAEVGAYLPVGLMQGVGGTIDVLSGTARRAPRAWQKLGLEWLYRLLNNPSRWRRQLVLVTFVLLVIRQRLLRYRTMRHAS